MVLNTSQKNYLWTSLRSFEESLHLAERVLASGSEKGVLYDRKLQMSGEQIDQAHQKIEAALQALAQLAGQLELQKREDNLNQSLSGQMSVSWADLIDARSDRLRGYGKVDPAVAEVLDPAAESLARMAKELGNLFSLTPQTE